MLKRIRAVQFDRPVTSGRTNPSFITCQADGGSLIEVVVKFSAACEMREINLAMEVVAACLAGDLGLPIPEPFLVEFSAEWASLIPDASRRERIAASSPVAFGSKLITGGYGIWSAGSRISSILLPTAAAIFSFDALVQNPDRRASNPNCLVKGDDVRIIDHEMAFSHRLTLGWVPPWRLGGLSALEAPGAHIFRDGLLGKEIDFERIRAAWNGLSEDRLAEYKKAIPKEWTNVGGAVEGAVKLVREVRENLEGCLGEIKRVLT